MFSITGWARVPVLDVLSNPRPRALDIVRGFFWFTGNDPRGYDDYRIRPNQAHMSNTARFSEIPSMVKMYSFLSIIHVINIYSTIRFRRHCDITVIPGTGLKAWFGPWVLKIIDAVLY
jgi:hypothetical protein